MNKDLRYLPTIILGLISAFHFYVETFTTRYIGGLIPRETTIYDYLYAIVFLVLALLSIKFSGKIFQWIVVLACLLWAMGGIVGYGWILALILGVVYIVIDKGEKNG